MPLFLCLLQKEACSANAEPAQEQERQGGPHAHAGHNTAQRRGCIYIHVYIYNIILVYMYIHMYTYIPMYICQRCMFVCSTYIYSYTCVYVYMPELYVYLYIYTYIHTLSVFNVHIYIYTRIIYTRIYLHMSM